MLVALKTIRCSLVKDTFNGLSCRKLTLSTQKSIFSSQFALKMDFASETFYFLRVYFLSPSYISCNVFRPKLSIRMPHFVQKSSMWSPKVAPRREGRSFSVGGLEDIRRSLFNNPFHQWMQERLFPADFDLVRVINNKKGYIFSVVRVKTG